MVFEFIGISIFAVALVLIGAILIIIPEPATTMTGILIVGIALAVVFASEILTVALSNWWGWAILLFIALIMMRRR